MYNLTPILKQTVKLVITATRRNHATYYYLENGVFKAIAYSIPKYLKKADYAPIIKTLVKDGVPIKKTAEMCGLSISYAYILLKK